MSPSRRLLVLVTALLLPLAALVALAAPPAVSAEPHRPDGPAPRAVLTDDVIRPEGSPLDARIRTWPGNKIRYHETMPKKWDWSLDRAIDHWNSSGGNIRFVEVSKRRAQLVIRYGPTYGADGVGTLGYQSRNYVHLSTAYKRADELNPETRVWVGRLFAHELGHVLGFDHTGGQCALMYPIYDFGLCPPLPFDHPGYYHCRWIDKPLLRRFTRIYGGSGKRPPKLCLIEALPGQLRDVEFGGGAERSAPVRITWKPPSRIRSGTKTRVTVWKGTSCGGKLPDTWERRAVVDTREGTWTDPSYGQGSWCFRLQIENRYGATRPPHSAAMQRYAPLPDAPQLGPLVWNADDYGYRFTWDAPADTWLYVMRGEPGDCPTTYDEQVAEYVSDGSGQQQRVYAAAGAECLSFFVVTEWDTVSPATAVEVAVPGLEAPDIRNPMYVEEEGGYRVTWVPPDSATTLAVMRSYEDPLECVTTYDAFSSEGVGMIDEDTWQVWAYAPEECVTFFAVNGLGLASAPTSILFSSARGAG